MPATMPVVNDRYVIRISVTPEAKSVISAWAEQNDMTEIGVASRIYEWFGKQTEVVQASVLGLIPKSVEADVAKLVLERMQGHDLKPQGVDVIDQPQPATPRQPPQQSPARDPRQQSKGKSR